MKLKAKCNNSTHRKELIMTSEIENKIRAILLSCFDNDKYLWSKAHEEFLALFDSTIQQKQEQILDDLDDALANDISISGETLLVIREVIRQFKEQKGNQDERI